MLDYSELTRRYAPWSLSKAKLAKNCPFSFDCRYVRKLRGIAPPKGSAGRIGVAVHQVLEVYLQGDSIKEAVRRAFADNELTTNEMDDVMSYMHNIVSFKDRLTKYKQRHNIIETHVEVRFGMTNDLKTAQFFGKNVFMRGVWDIAMRTQEHAVVVDHKSGMLSSDTDVFERYGDQLKLYAIAALDRFPGIKGVMSAIHYVMSEDIIFSPMISTRKIREQYVPWLADYLNNCSRDIETKEARVGWYCQFCDYTHVCPEKRIT